MEIEGSVVSALERLPCPVLDIILKFLPLRDLVMLSMVSKYFESATSGDEHWRTTAEKEEFCKADEEASWKANYQMARHGEIYFNYSHEGPFLLKGNILIINPFNAFFVKNSSQSVMLREVVENFRRNNVSFPRKCWFTVWYRGFKSIFISSRVWDKDAVFEVNRDGRSVGCDDASSNAVALIPQKLAELLATENGEPIEGGVSCEGVDGEFLSSGDGDFVITRASPCPNSAKISRWIEDDHPAVNVDILGATGNAVFSSKIWSLSAHHLSGWTFRPSIVATKGVTALLGGLHYGSSTSHGKSGLSFDDLAGGCWTFSDYNSSSETSDDEADDEDEEECMTDEDTSAWEIKQEVERGRMHDIFPSKLSHKGLVSFPYQYGVSEV